ncbi:MAG: hypothetical protein QOF76_1740 [Solirubrobacteraceae bacterium]|jgi:hypothetical protein|nr:hypothetical protein [Solirubrobacteraceae bacterium]
MNSERAIAYGRVVATIEDVGTTKFQPAEIERLRIAADTLLFSENLDAPGARDALEDIEELTDHLVTSGRWADESAARLFDDLAECGPVAAASRR